MYVSFCVYVCVCVCVSECMCVSTCTSNSGQVCTHFLTHDVKPSEFTDFTRFNILPLPAVANAHMYHPTWSFRVRHAFCDIRV